MVPFTGTTHRWTIIAAVTLCCLAVGSAHPSSPPPAAAACQQPECPELVCVHGTCGPHCECECLLCYSGPTCETYEDRYGPRFATHEDTVILDPQHKGVVYKAVAEDEDLGLTCPLGPGRNSRCPCAAIHYDLRSVNHGSRSLFHIHDSSGQVFLRPGVQLEPGGRYQARIIASSVNDSQGEFHRSLFDVQTLTVVVRRGDPLKDLLLQEFLPGPATTALSKEDNKGEKQLTRLSESEPGLLGTSNPPRKTDFSEAERREDPDDQGPGETVVKGDAQHGLAPLSNIIFQLALSLPPL